MLHVFEQGSVLNKNLPGANVSVEFLEMDCQSVLEGFSLSSSQMGAFLELSKRFLWQSGTRHPDHVASPMKLVQDDHCPSPGAVWLLKSTNIHIPVLLADVENLSQQTLISLQSFKWNLYVVLDYQAIEKSLEDEYLVCKNLCIRTYVVIVEDP